MALASYANLKTAVNSFLGGLQAADLSDVIDDLIFIAENRIWAELHTRDFSVSLSHTISSGVVAIPSDFLDWLDPVVVTSTDTTQEYEIIPATAGWIHENYPQRASQSKPEYVASEGSNFIFGPYPDSGTVWLLKGTYKGKLKRVSTSATDNLIFARRPEIYLYATMAQAEKVLGRDQRSLVWEQQYRSIRDLLNSEDQNSTGQARPYL